MASIPGSHFIATAPNQAVNVVETSGGPLPPPQPGEFNLEVWTGSPGASPSQPAHDYQGLAMLSDGGQEIDLITGALAVTDAGSGNDTINADGDNETISGGTAAVTLNIFGNNDVANGGGADSISVYGNSDTVNGAGNDVIAVFGINDSVNAGSGNDTINIFGDHAQITAGGGDDSINLYGDHIDLDGGNGNETVNVFGSNSAIDLNIGNAVVGTVAGEHDTVNGGIGNETINVSGDHDLAVTGVGLSRISVNGLGDTVEAGDQRGTSLAQITVGGANFTFEDSGTQPYADTIMGFEQAAGDRIHLMTEASSDAIADSKQVNGGHDTLITLDDGSTILLKGVSHIDHGFFS